MTDHIKIHESPYGGAPLNFHITKHNDEVWVELTYPPRSDAENTENQVRHVYVNQESVRASDGIRMHYDYDRDGFVVEQPTNRFIKLDSGSYDTVTDWTEVGFFGSWALDNSDGMSLDEQEDAKFRAADAAYNAAKQPKGTA